MTGKDVRLVFAFLVRKNFLHEIYKTFFGEKLDKRFGVMIITEEKPVGQDPWWPPEWNIKARNNLLRSQLALFQVARSRFENFQRLIVCTGDTVPIRSADYIYRFVMDSQISFIPVEEKEKGVFTGQLCNVYVSDQANLLATVGQDILDAYEKTKDSEIWALQTTLSRLGALKRRFNENKSVVATPTDEEDFHEFLTRNKSTAHCLFAQNVTMSLEQLRDALTDTDSWTEVFVSEKPQPKPSVPDAVLDDSGDPPVKIPVLPWEQTSKHVHYEKQEELFCGLHALNHVMQQKKVWWSDRKNLEFFYFGTHRPADHDELMESAEVVANAKVACEKHGLLPEYAEQIDKAWNSMFFRMQKPFNKVSQFTQFDDWLKDFEYITKRKPTLADLDRRLSKKTISSKEKDFRETWIRRNVVEAVRCTKGGNLPIGVLAQLARNLGFKTVAMTGIADFRTRSDKLLQAPQCLGVLSLFKSQSHWIAAVKYGDGTPEDHLRIYDSSVGVAPEELIVGYFNRNNYGEDETARLFIFAVLGSYDCPAVRHWGDIGRPFIEVIYDKWKVDKPAEAKDSEESKESEDSENSD